jgi:TrmH family RNA methyltransferase
MGVVARNCAAFGVHALITDETCASPFLRRAVRNSMGTIFKLPVVEAASLVETLRQLRSRGIVCIAAHPRADHSPLPRSNLSGDCCLVFGSEGHGLSSAVVDACDHAVAIPMANDVDSLNIGNACAVFLYEAHRQRSKI